MHASTQPPHSLGKARYMSTHEPCEHTGKIGVTIVVTLPLLFHLCAVLNVTSEIKNYYADDADMSMTYARIPIADDSDSPLKYVLCVRAFVPVCVFVDYCGGVVSI